MTTRPYEVQNLDVYRMTIRFSTRIYQAAKGEGAIEEKIRAESLALVLNLASGLGFWEKEWKSHHFLLTKTAVMNLTSLIELWRAMGGLEEAEWSKYQDELRDIGIQVKGLLRQVKRKEADGA